VLDPVGYGAVTITKAISIVNDGVGVAAIGSLGAPSGNAGASDSVHLRGLTIEGFGSGISGILFNTGENLEIENCVIRNFGNVGIEISPSTSSSFSLLPIITRGRRTAGRADGHIRTPARAGRVNDDGPKRFPHGLHASQRIVAGFRSYGGMAFAVAGDAMANALEAPQFLDVEMD
jgi:hypothetical protein